MSDPVRLPALPPLRNTLVLAAFQGWNDAGEVASDALAHLGRQWDAQPVGELDPDEFYDFQVNRPTARFGADGDRRIDWPTTRFAHARPDGLDRDVLLVHGIEPNNRWRAFTAELVAAFRAADASLVVTFGALLADTPHTRPIPVSAVAHDGESAARLDAEVSRYEGPTGIVGVLHEACVAAGFDALSLWAAVPHYVAQPPSPKATIAMLHRVEDLLDIAVDLGDLDERARGWEQTVDELAASDGDIAEYVRTLEQRSVTELPEASGEAIAREFERFLRRRGGR